jgi:hypothetical protein
MYPWIVLTGTALRSVVEIDQAIHTNQGCRPGLVSAVRVFHLLPVSWQ